MCHEYIQDISANWANYDPVIFPPGLSHRQAGQTAMNKAQQ